MNLAVSTHSERATPVSTPGTDWALRLFRKSPLKQRKFRKICELLEETKDKTCLDLGSDNGVISLLLRRIAGNWFSADITPETVESIRSLVGNQVVQIEEQCLPFADSYFDTIVVVDLLEHISAETDFINELKRVLRTSGTLILNVPNPHEGLLRKIKNLLGQTDKAHGHLRPGYSLTQLQQLLGEQFLYEQHQEYARFFSEFIDTVITLALDLLKPGGRGKKGTVLTATDLNKLKKSFRIYSFIYPFVQLTVWLDKLIPWTHGNMLIARFRKLH